MFLMGPGAGATCTSTAATAATTAVCRVGWVVNVNRGQTMRARALSSHVAPSASALSSSGVVVAPRLPLHGCPVTRPMVRGGGGYASSTSAVSRLHLKADNDGVCIKRQQAEGHLPALIPIEDGDRIVQVHGFSERANWLVPGKILLGKYPGQIPSDLPTDPQTARDRVREIVLRGGATDFLSLQAELPPQADESQWDAPADKTDDGLFFSGFRAYRGDALAAVTEGRENRNGQSPGVNGGSRGEQGAGIGAGAEVAAATAGLTFHHFPIPDLSPAENMAVLSGLVDDLELLVAAGKVLFIHCWAGRGRTGLIAACLLGKLYPEVGAEQALNRVDAYYRCRGTVAVGKTSRVSPETEEQEDQVRLFFAKVLKR